MAAHSQGRTSAKEEEALMSWTLSLGSPGSLAWTVLLPGRLALLPRHGQGFI